MHLVTIAVAGGLGALARYSLTGFTHRITAWDFPIGTLLRVLPNHACMTAAAHESYNVLEPGRESCAHWMRENGW